MIRAVVFDFDGVILDTETPDFVSWREVFTGHGVELTLETWSQGIGTYPSAFDVYAHLMSLDNFKFLMDRAAERSKSARLVS